MHNEIHTSESERSWQQYMINKDSHQNVHYCGGDCVTAACSVFTASNAHSKAPIFYLWFIHSTRSKRYSK